MSAACVFFGYGTYHSCLPIGRGITASDTAHQSSVQMLLYTSNTTLMEGFRSSPCCRFTIFEFLIFGSDSGFFLFDLFRSRK